MKAGDLVRIIKNDMSLSFNSDGQRDRLFFSKIGIIVDKYSALKKEVWSRGWFDVMFDIGIYHVREDALEIIDENR